LISYIRFRKTW